MTYTNNNITAGNGNASNPLETITKEQEESHIDGDVNEYDMELNIGFGYDYSANDEDDSRCPVQPYLTSPDDLEEVETGELSDGDREFFKVLDDDISVLWDNFIAVGFALTAIKNGQLYREKHPSFAAYCEAKTGLKHIDEKDAIFAFINGEIQRLFKNSEKYLTKLNNGKPTTLPQANGRATHANSIAANSKPWNRLLLKLLQSQGTMIQEMLSRLMPQS